MQRNVSPSSRRRRARRFGAVVLTLFTFVTLSALKGYNDLRTVRSSALGGVDRLTTIRASWSDQKKVQSTIELAQADFAAAAHTARSPWLTMWRGVPLLRRQVDTVRDLADSGRNATATALGLYDEIRTAHQAGSPDSMRPAELARLSASLATGANKLQALPSGADSFLAAPLRRARDRFVFERASAVRTLTNASTVLSGLSDLLAGPSRYVVLATNNAEMKVGMGTALFVGTLTAENGGLTLGELEKPGLPVAAAPFVNSDLERNWGSLFPNRDVRLTGITPRFDVAGAQAATTWGRRNGIKYDGAISFDVEFIRTLLGATGPVSVDTRVFDASNVVRFLTYDQYFLPDRNAINVQLAREVFDRLTKGLSSQDLGTAKAILDAVQGRHLMLWSSNLAQQLAWETAGAAGALTNNSLMFGLVNRSDKLDPFLDVSADVRVAARYRDRTDLVMAVNVRNTATGSEPKEINGADDKWLAQSPSEYRAFVSVSVPGAATLLRIDRFTTYLALGKDGPSMMAAVSDFIVPGATKSYVVRFSLPVEQRRMRIEPSARLPGVRWSFEGTQLSDDRAHTVDLKPAAP